jgi:hypothetical protein
LRISRDCGDVMNTIGHILLRRSFPGNIVALIPLLKCTTKFLEKFR